MVPAPTNRNVHCLTLKLECCRYTPCPTSDTHTLPFPVVVLHVRPLGRDFPRRDVLRPPTLAPSPSPSPSLPPVPHPPYLFSRGGTCRRRRCPGQATRLVSYLLVRFFMGRSGCLRRHLAFPARQPFVGPGLASSFGTCRIEGGTGRIWRRRRSIGHRPPGPADYSMRVMSSYFFCRSASFPSSCRRFLSSPLSSRTSFSRPSMRLLRVTSGTEAGCG